MLLQDNIIDDPAVSAPRDSAGIAAIIAIVEPWLLDRKLITAGFPVSLRRDLREWRSQLPSVEKSTARAVLKLKRKLTHLSLASAPHAAVLLQKAIFQRLLRGPQPQSLTDGSNAGPVSSESRQWTASIGAGSILPFSPFSMNLLLALHNALSLLQSMHAMQPRDVRRSIMEFARQAGRHFDTATLGDLLAARVIKDAVVDLEPEFRRAAARLSHRTWRDWFRWRRWEMRRNLGRRIKEWFTRAINRLTPIDPLEPLLDPGAPNISDETLVHAMRELAKRQIPPPFARWFGWIVARFISAKDNPSWACLTLLRELLANDDFRSVNMATCAVEELLAWMHANDKPAMFSQLRAGGNQMPELCGLLVLRIFEARVQLHGDAPEFLGSRLERSIAGIVHAGNRAEQPGQLFVGEFLLCLARGIQNDTWQNLAAQMTSLKLFNLYRDWLSATHGKQGELDQLRRDLAKAHPDLERIRRLHQTAADSMQRLRMKQGSGGYRFTATAAKRGKP